MAGETYIVCDMIGVPEQGNEDMLVYVRKISQTEIQAVRTAERKFEYMMRVNEIQKKAKLSEVFSPDQISRSLKEREHGKFEGLYLVKENSFALPKVGFTYDQMPSEWEHVKNPSKKKIIQTNLGDLVKEQWWNLS